MSPCQVEICANSLLSAQHAKIGGADRIELCANLQIGGTTPSHGLIEQVLSLGIETHVLIRPRAGAFVYSDEEFDVILSDIRYCREMGCSGVVIGFLDEYHNVDVELAKVAIDMASDMDVTFHRAFDGVDNPMLALEQIRNLGYKRILTSGLSMKAIDGKDMLQSLVQKADGNIQIMAGSGVNSSNVRSLFDIGIRHFHASCSTGKNIVFPSGNPVLQSFHQEQTFSDLNLIQRLVDTVQSFSK